MTPTFSSDLADDRGILDTRDGNLISWETRGNPDGKPAVIVHGGPGAGRPSGSPRSFDPQRYRIILFDQRGCGLSTPHAADPATDMSLNTTEHLLGDMEQLREHLGVERWLLFGGSWGSALALAYAERHPDRVSEIVMPAFWSMSRAETDWLYRGGVSPVFPREWEQFVNGIPETDRSGDLVDAYVRQLESPDPDVRAGAAVEWASWEDAVLSLEPLGKLAPYSSRATDALQAFVRICAHYAKHDGWLEDGALLGNVGRLAGIPAVIVHCRLDWSCPLANAWAFKKVWSDLELIVIDDAGHKSSPTMNQTIRDVLQRFSV
jgi:proline iminopeptidase